MKKFDGVSPWKPMQSAIDLKHLGKLGEELGELSAAVSRCIIQGIDEREPTTGKPNRQWLAEEVSDVLANCGLVIHHFNLDQTAMNLRIDAKTIKLKEWHSMLIDPPAPPSLWRRFISRIWK